MSSDPSHLQEVLPVQFSHKLDKNASIHLFIHTQINPSNVLRTLFIYIFQLLEQVAYMSGHTEHEVFMHV